MLIAGCLRPCIDMQLSCYGRTRLWRSQLWIYNDARHKIDRISAARLTCHPVTTHALLISIFY